ncbi:MAG: cyclic nucleotide-binding domain-containing protein [Planctomycetota bacterium]|nr:cyclic nucleotide-binding domain-containing protein [Planctomycetota bacterium]
MFEARKLFKQGQKLASEGKPAEAIESYTAASRLSDDAGIDAHCSIAHLSLGQTHEALQCIRRARKWEPANPAFQLTEALVWLDHGDLGKAVGLAQEVIRNSPNNSLAFNILALVSWVKGDIDAAICSMQQYGICDNLQVRVRLMILIQMCMPNETGQKTEVSPPSLVEPAGGPLKGLRGKMALDKGVRQLFGGKAIEALKSIERAQNLKPKQTGLAYYRGFTLIEMGRFEEALAALEDVPTDDFFAAHTEFFRAVCLLKTGRIDAAEVALKGLQERVATETQLTDFQEYIPCLLGEIAISRGDLRSARLYYTRALSIWGPLLDQLLGEAIKLRSAGKFPKNDHLALLNLRPGDYTEPPPASRQRGMTVSEEFERPEKASEDAETTESESEMSKSDESTDHVSDAEESAEAAGEVSSVEDDDKGAQVTRPEVSAEATDGEAAEGGAGEPQNGPDESKEPDSEKADLKDANESGETTYKSEDSTPAEILQAESFSEKARAAAAEEEDDDDHMEITEDHLDEEDVNLPRIGAGGTSILRRAIAGADEVMFTIPEPVEGVICLELDDGPTSRFYMLKHPDDGSYMRIDSRERFIWRKMDGDTSLAEIVEAYYRKYNSLGFKSIERLYHKLEDTGFLKAASETTGQTAIGEVEGWLEEAKTRLAFRPIGPKGGDGLFQSFLNAGGAFLFAETVLASFVLLGIGSLIAFVLSLSGSRGREAYEIFRPGGGYYSSALLGIYLWNFFGSFIHTSGRGIAVKSNFCKVNDVSFVLRFGLLGFYADIRDSKRLSKRTQVLIHLTGIAIEIFAAGVLGALAIINNQIGSSALLRDLLALGACVLGMRVFLHLCPLTKSEGYIAATEGMDSPHLRKAAIRFLRPKYWSQLWTKTRWQKSEVAFLLFGLWCVVWLTMAAKFATFVLKNQFTSTVVELVSALFSQNAQISLDELFALLMIFMVLVPAVLFLTLSAFFVASSTYRMFRQMGTWTNPTSYVLGTAISSLFIGFLGFLFYAPESSISQVFWGVAVMLGIPMFLIVFSQANAETEGNIARGWALPQLLGSAACVVTATGALFQYSVPEGRGMLLMAGLILAAVAMLMVLKNLFSSMGTFFDVIWFGKAVGLGTLLATGYPQGLATLRGASVPEISGFALSMIIAGGLYFQANAWGLWFVASHYQPSVPDYDLDESETEEELLLAAFNFSLNTLLLNLERCGGQAFLETLKSELKKKAGDLELNFESEDHQLISIEGNKDKEFDELVAPMRAMIGHSLTRGFSVTGATALTNTLRELHKHLHWDERYMLSAHLIQDPRWASAIGVEKEFSKDDRFALLKSTFLFHNFEDAELTQIARIVNSKTYKIGELIIKQDDPGNEAYVIQSGRVEVVVEDETGDYHVVASLSAGDFFGELALLEDMPRSANVRAVAETHVLVLERPIFDKFVQRAGGARDKLANAIRALRVIQRMPLFEEFGAGEMATVASKFQLERYLAGERIIQQGELGDKFYIIQDGMAEVLVTGEEQEEKIRTLRPGEYFGEIALLQNIPRTASVQASGPLILFSLAKPDFLDALGGHPFAKLKLQQESARRLASVEQTA